MVSATAFSQDEAKVSQKISLGIKAGFNVAQITHVENSRPLVGYHAGLFGEWKLTNHFAVQPELAYASQGVMDNHGAYVLTYVQLPILAKYWVSNCLTIEAGPQVGFLTEATFKQTGGGSAGIKESFNTVDWSVNLGGQYYADAHLFVGLRYNLDYRSCKMSCRPSRSHRSIPFFRSR